MPSDLRLLLRLTLVSFGIGVLGQVLGFALEPDRITVTPAGSAAGAGLLAGSLLLMVGVYAGLYALVYFPLREQRQWGWILGIVFASMAVLATVLNLVLMVVLPGGATAGLLIGVGKTAVDIAWLVVAVRPRLRAALH